jgi:hypothetical protein
MPINMKPIQRKRITLRIVGESPLQMNQWDEKAKNMMREKQQEGRKTTERAKRNPKAECEAATYRIGKKYAIPGMALKRSMITAAHKDLGIEKTLVRKALFLIIENEKGLIPLDKHSEPWMREDIMRVGMLFRSGRYRPEFREWSVIVTFEIDSDLINEADLLKLVDRAGFGVGILEGRPERGRDFGRFKVDPNYKLKIETIG